MEKKIVVKMKQRIMNKIASIEGDINEYKEKFNEDYEKFLMWYAEWKSHSTLPLLAKQNLPPLALM